MRKLLILLILSFFSSQSFAVSCPDGSEPVKSVSDDGSYFVYNCGGQTSSSSSSNTKALAGIDIENDPTVDFFRAPMAGYYPAFQMKEAWQMGDFNNDGYVDVIYVGSMKYDSQNMVGEDTGGLCGGGECKGNKPLPQLFLGDENGKLTKAKGLLIDNREDPGMSLGKGILVADYNNDGVLDFYIYDHGVGTHDGFRDSYFLSQSNGTWLESSSTHLSHPNFQVFDHGGAVGDIDNDGDMDVVITESNWKTGTFLWCLMNDGSGFLNKRKCGGIFSFALELADMDGDGDLDAIVGSNEFSPEKDSHMTPAIVWNDGRGNFNKNNRTNLKIHRKLGNTPEVSAADLDGDGDLDIVYSRAGHLYVGTAVSIIENLGNKKFKDHGLIHLLKAPEGYIAVHEGNPWNAFISMIKFRDLDKDGDMDIYLGGSAPATNGMVLLNEGNFNFLRYMLSENGELSSIINIDEEKAKLAVQLKKINDEKKSQEEEKAKLTAELKKSQKEEKAKRLAEERENNKNNFKYSTRYFKSQLKLLESQNNVEVCNAISKEFYTGDYYSRTKKKTYFFVSLNSNGKDCHYEWSTNIGNTLSRCETNTKFDGKCTIYALGDNIVWGNPRLYKELTGRE